MNIDLQDTLEKYTSACEGGEAENILRMIREENCNPKHLLNWKRQPLHYAAAYGRLELVRILVDTYRCNFNWRDAYGCTPLHHACYHGQVDVVKYLVNNPRGWKTVMTDFDENSLLHYACSSGSERFLQSIETPTVTANHYEIVKFLICKCGHDPKKPNKYGAVPLVLHVVCRYGSLEFVKCLIQEKTCDPNQWNSSGNTALDLAITCGQLETAKYLIEGKHCDPNSNNCQGNTALHLACMHEHLSIVQYLTQEQNVKLNVLNREQQLPLDIACHKSSLPMVKLVSNDIICSLFTEMKGETPIHIACKQNNLDIIKYFIEEKGLKLTGKSSTVLQCACHYYEWHSLLSSGLFPLNVDSIPVYKAGNDAKSLPPVNLELVRYLIKECGCDPMECSECEKSPMNTACMAGNLELVKVLVSDKVDHQDQFGNTPLHYACKHQQVEIVRFLTKEKNCSQSIINKLGKLPLHIACDLQSLELVKMVSSYDVHMFTQHENFANCSASTPLHIACRLGSLEIIRYLVEQKLCNPQQHWQFYSDLPLHKVLEFGDLELLRMLTTCENVNYQDKCGNTLLHLACKMGKLEVVEYLVKKMNCQQFENEERQLPLHIAGSQNSLEILKLVSNVGTVNVAPRTTSYMRMFVREPETPLHIACRHGTVEMVGYLVDGKQHNPNTVNRNGELPLHLACMRGCLDMVKLVSACDVNRSLETVDIYIQNQPVYSGDTALHIACRDNSVDIVRYLIEEIKCDPSIENHRNELPIHLACRHTLETVKLVINNHIRNQRDGSGDTALHIACRNNAVDIVTYLIKEEECDPLIKNHRNELPIHLACRHSLETVKLVINNHIRNQRDGSGDTALHIACRNNAMDIVRYLIKEECDPSIENHMSQLPIHLACRYSLEMVKLVSKCTLKPTQSQYRMLLDVACSEGNIHIVKYVFEEWQHNTHIEDPAFNPLQFLCYLHESVTNGHIAVTKYLVTQCGCDPMKGQTSSPIETACQTGNVDLVRALTSTDVNCLDDAGNTPLHLACNHNQVKVARLLTEERRCNQNIRNVKGELPLHIVCASGTYELVKLVSSCDVNAQNVDGNTPLHVTLIHMNGSAVKKRKATICYRPPWYILPNHMSKEESMEIVKFLVCVKGCSTSIANIDDNIPIHIACDKNELELVKLLATLTDLSHPNKDGDTPLHIACRNASVETVRELAAMNECHQNIQNKAGQLALHIACERESLKLVEIVSNCKDPNTGDSNGNTPLHVAAITGVGDIVEYLISSKNCNPTITNKKGALPLHLATIRGVHRTMVLVGKCNVDAQTESGDTALHVACRTNRRKAHIVNFLIKKLKCNPNIQNSEGESPLHIACSNKYLHFVQVLRNSNPNLKTKSGDTPLHIACNQGNKRIVNYLVHCLNCNQSIPNNAGELPLHICCRLSSDMILVLLVSNCNPDCKIKEGDRPIKSQSVKSNQSPKSVAGDTPLHIACRAHNFELMDFLIKDKCCSLNVFNDCGESPLHIACEYQYPYELQRLYFELQFLHDNMDDPTESDERPPPCIFDEPFEYESLSPWIFDEYESPPPCEPLGPPPLSYIDRFLYYVDKFATDSNLNSQTTEGNTPLHIACKQGATDVIQYLVKVKHCNVGIQNRKGKLPLHIMCSSWWLKLDFIKLLSNCDVNTSTNTGDTPLHIACKNGATDVIQYLVRTKHCNVGIQNRKGELPLHIMCSSWQPKLDFIELLSNCDVNTSTNTGDTPLHIACYNSNTLVMLYLLQEKQCDPTIQNLLGELPLHIACSKDPDTTMLRLLSQCDINLQTLAGDTALHIACRNGSQRTVEYLVTVRNCDTGLINSTGELPLHIACQKQDLDVVRLVGEKVMDATSHVTKHGDSLLHEACRNSRHSWHIVNYLKVKGCLPVVQNKRCELPVHIACELLSLETVKQVSEDGIDLNSQSITGDTPLHLACRNKRNSVEIAKYLVEVVNCDPNIQNSEQQQPLHIACQRKSYELVQLVSKCDKNVKNKSGNTPLHEVCKYQSSQLHQENSVIKISKFLIEEKGCNPDCEDSRGRSILPYACELNLEDVVNYLLSTGKVNASASDCDGNTPIILTTSAEVIKTLIQHGADPEPLYQLHRKFFERFSSDSPPPIPLKVLVVGNASTGKTTLVESIKCERGEAPRCTETLQHTAGIIPHDFKSEIFGCATFYDFAGQHEYYASHEAVIHSIVKHSPPVILLVADMNENEHDIIKKLLYWLSFIENQTVSVSKAPHVIVVGSHADQLQLHGINPDKWMDTVFKLLRQRSQNSHPKLVGYAAMDCRLASSPGIAQLRKVLQESSKQLQTRGVMNFTSHCFYAFLVDQFQKFTAVSVAHIMSALTRISKDLSHYSVHSSRKPTSLLPSKESDVTSHLEKLNEMGPIIFLKNLKRPQMSWVIFDKEVLLEQINGTVFAPQSFSQHIDIASSTGVVPFSKISTNFPDHDPNMLVSFLSHMEFCQEIHDQEVLQLLTSSDDYNPVAFTYSSERYFFFPRLVRIEVPKRVWKPSPQWSYTCGWVLECAQSDHFLTPRFLQILLLRLAFSFAAHATDAVTEVDEMPAIRRKCSIWKRGICWINTRGVETLVEVVEQNQAVVVMIRCMNKIRSKVECIRLRSSVIQEVLKAKEEFCPRLEIVESLLDPENLTYPPMPTKEMTRYSMHSIAQTLQSEGCCILNDSGDFVDAEKLLYFDPFLNLRSKVLKKLFSDDKSDALIKDDYLYDIADSILHNPENIEEKKKILIELFNLPQSMLQGRINYAPRGQVNELARVFQLQRDRSDGTYDSLRRVLGSFSVFCGRNPSVSVQVVWNSIGVELS